MRPVERRRIIAFTYSSPSDWLLPSVLRPKYATLAKSDRSSLYL